LSYSPNANYCIKYCVVVKALRFPVWRLVAILTERIHKCWI